MIVALVPAHNEEALLPGAIDALQRQTVAIDRIVVISDNSSDRTPVIAREWGGAVELFETRHNVDKKSGALNQAILTLDLPDDDIVLVMDADSRIVPAFVETALGRLADPTVGAVGGIFLAEGGEEHPWPAPGQRIHPLRPGDRPRLRQSPRPHRDRDHGPDGHPARGGPRPRIRPVAGRRASTGRTP